MDLKLFCFVFGLTFLAELPDKTAFATMFMATHRRASAVWLGACLAFVVQSAVAVSCGTLIGMIPRRIIEGLTGAVFLALSIAMWRRPVDHEASPPIMGHAGFWASVVVSFVTIFLAEWGDLTQISTAALVARYSHPFTIFTAATLALWSVSALAVGLGHRLRHTLQRRFLERIAAVVFAFAGIVFAIQALF